MNVTGDVYDNRTAKENMKTLEEQVKETEEEKEGGEDVALTVAYARMLCDAGAQLLTIHGRTRVMKGQHTGQANLSVIAAVHKALHHRVPIFTNGNVLCFGDVLQNLSVTGC
uniref:tRNA-dihydrouridine(16/17) synthase [NAD(P)(+)]-like protein n=1 Tax=Lygus hesperus TaxID=30085 RepID=A0A0A9ZGN9_LYGHE